MLNAGLQHPDAATLAAHYVPRLSLVIFIEVFSFFFLRLYRTSLSEIKYFQNELTNIEAKFIALDSALATNDQESAKAVVLELAKTERNFILDKGQSTVELQRHRIESRTIKDVLDSAGDLVKKARG